MKENTLLKIALVCSLMGLVILYFISMRIDIKDYRPSILNKNVGDDVKLEGIVTKISSTEGVSFVEVEHTNTVTIVLFNTKNISLSKGNLIEVFGKVEDYKGKEEIIAQRVRVIK